MTAGLPDTVADGAFPLAVLVAALAGLVSFASPCVLPFVPGYLGYVTGLSDLALERRGRGRMVLGALGFVAGFSLVFVLVTMFVATAGHGLVEHRELLTRVGGGLVVLMALVFLGAGTQRTLRHVTVATLSVGIFILGAILSALYLIRDRQTGEAKGLWAKLPPAAQLEKLSYAAHIVAFPLWTFTLIAGAIWARQAWGAYWNWDPKEVWTFVIWVVYAAYLHARATKHISRRTAAWLALAGFGCIVINYTVVNFYFIGQHSYAQ